MAEDRVVDIRLSNLTKRFEGVVAVDDLSLEIERGRFFALLGPSGCGKTTTLRMIGGFEEPTSGRIELGDRDVAALPPYKRDVNTVFQSYALFPHLSVFENVAFGLRRQKVRGEELKKRVRDALELVKDKETRETFTDDECETLLRGFLSPALFEKGLICRADDRGDPVVQISPPLIATQKEFDEIAGTLGEVLDEAWQKIA